jgi:hypothetical protein
MTQIWRDAGRGYKNNNSIQYTRILITKKYNTKFAIYFFRIKLMKYICLLFIRFINRLKNPISTRKQW